jgi:hypothetical protein
MRIEGRYLTTAWIRSGKKLRKIYDIEFKKNCEKISYTDFVLKKVVVLIKLKTQRKNKNLINQKSTEGKKKKKKRNSLDPAGWLFEMCTPSIIYIELLLYWKKKESNNIWPPISVCFPFSLACVIRFRRNKEKGDSRKFPPVKKVEKKKWRDWQTHATHQSHTHTRKKK